MSLTFGPPHAWGVGPTPERGLFVQFWGCQNIPTTLIAPSPEMKTKTVIQLPPQTEPVQRRTPDVPPNMPKRKISKKLSRKLSSCFTPAPSNLFLERRLSYTPPDTIFLSTQTPRFSVSPTHNEASVSSANAAMTDNSSSSANGPFDMNIEDDFSDTDAMPEPPTQPPQLFPGPSQTMTSCGTSFFANTGAQQQQQSDSDEAARVAAARKIAIDSASHNYRCGRAECAQTGHEPPPPVLYRQKAFSFKEEIVVKCVVCKKQERLVVLY